MTELMSLEDIDNLSNSVDDLSQRSFYELRETARAAHKLQYANDLYYKTLGTQAVKIDELQEKLAKARAAHELQSDLEDCRQSNEQLLNELAGYDNKLIKARAAERERCAKVADQWDLLCSREIRNLKDSE